jgi:predicted DNA-binding WGR domain protein
MVRLECTTAGHNKYYEFHAEGRNGDYKVVGRYGAIGQAPKEALVYDGPDKIAANKQYQRKLVEKQKKGYVIVSINGMPALSPAEKKTLMFQ